MTTLDLSDASKLLKMHPQTVLRLSRIGVIPAAKPGKCWVFIEEDLVNWSTQEDSVLQPSQDTGGQVSWELMQQYAEALCSNRINTYVEVSKIDLRIEKYHVYRSVATPRWLTYEERTQMRALYKQASSTSLSVDHIIPLRGRNVCGLHVPWNLRLIPLRENQRKNNL